MVKPSSDPMSQSARPDFDAVEDRGWTPRLIGGMIAIIALLEMLAMSFLMLSTALPSITAHYKTTQGAWLFTAFQLVGAVACPLLGKLADMYGKRRVLLIVMALATIGMVMSALAPSFAVMIAGRAVSGLMCSCMFLSYSLIRDVFPPRSVALAVSIATSGMGLVMVPAPFFTGYLLDNFGFRSIFWFMAGGLVVIGLTMVVCLDESTVRVRSKVDFLGAALIGGGIGGVLIAISVGPDWGWTSVPTVSFLVGGLILTALWAVSARVIREPLFDLALVRRRAVFLTAVGGGIGYGVSTLLQTMLPILVMVPAVLGLGYGWGMTAEDYAFFQLPLVLAVILGGLAVGFLVTRGLRPRVLMISGLGLMGVGLTLAAFDHSNTTTLIVFATIVGFGQGLCYAASPNLVIEAVGPELQASTASIVAVSQAMVPGIMTVIAFTILNNSHVAVIQDGVTFYGSNGFRDVFLFGAVISVIGMLFAFALPRHIVAKRAQNADAEAALIAH